MSIADDLQAPPLARRVAQIIKDHASRLELGPDWADAAALRVLVEVGRKPALTPEAWDVAHAVREDIRADFLNDEGRPPWER